VVGSVGLADLPTVRTVRLYLSMVDQYVTAIGVVAGRHAPAAWLWVFTVRLF